MEKIVDVYGYNKEFGDDYSKDDSWFGRILLGEDEQFEGIVEDYQQKNCYFIFGQLTKESIRLMKCSRGDLEIPFIYEGLKEKDAYYGSLTARNAFTEIPLGESRIAYLSSDATREDSEWERRDLKGNIARMKHHLGPIGNTLHERFEVSRAYTPVKTFKK